MNVDTDSSHADTTSVDVNKYEDAQSPANSTTTTMATTVEEERKKKKKKRKRSAHIDQKELEILTR